MTIELLLLGFYLRCDNCYWFDVVNHLSPSVFILQYIIVLYCVYPPERIIYQPAAPRDTGENRSVFIRRFRYYYCGRSP